MLYIKITARLNGKPVQAVVATEADREGSEWRTLETRNDWRTFDDAKAIAAALGEGYVATDAGAHVSPRYDVIALPKVGAKVSYAFNGDYYPCGEIASISKSLRLITTTEGQKFYRVRESGCWKYNRTWSLVEGHINRRNPEF